MQHVYYIIKGDNLFRSMFSNLVSKDTLNTTYINVLFIHNNSEYVTFLLSFYSLFFIQANINGRVLAQCNIDELKKEMNMNFGDWHLFRSTVRYFLSTELFALCKQVPGSTDLNRYFSTLK